MLQIQKRQFFATLAKFCHCKFCHCTHVVRQSFGAILSSSDTFLCLMLFSISTCLILQASTERKIGLLPSTAMHTSVMTCDTSACHGSRGKIHQAFSLLFCILQAIKNWSREGLETSTAVDMAVPKSFPGLCTPHVQVVHQP